MIETKPDSRATHIAELLRGRRMRAAEIVVETGYPMPTVRGALGMLARHGIITRVARGQYEKRPQS